MLVSVLCPTLLTWVNCTSLREISISTKSRLNLSVKPMLMHRLYRRARWWLLVLSPYTHWRAEKNKLDFAKFLFRPQQTQFLRRQAADLVKPVTDYTTLLLANWKKSAKNVQQWFSEEKLIFFVVLAIEACKFWIFTFPNLVDFLKESLSFTYIEGESSLMLFYFNL